MIVIYRHHFAWNLKYICWLFTSVAMETISFFWFSSNFRKLTCFNMHHLSLTVEFCMFLVQFAKSRLGCNSKHEICQVVRRRARFFFLNLPLPPIVISTKKQQQQKKKKKKKKKRTLWSPFRLNNHVSPVSDILYCLEKDKYEIQL